jgi:serralysin
VIDIEWSIDGEIVGGDQTTLNIATLGLTVGTHTITARAFDNTDLVRVNRADLEQTITWKVDLTSNLAKVMVGTEADDILIGGILNNTITGLSGNDSLDGGAGQDTATYAGSRTDYVVFTASTGKTLVVDTVAGRDGKDNLQNIEDIRFGVDIVTLAIALVEPTDADNSAFQAYRFYNTQTGSHFFTTSIAERNSVIEKLDGLSYEGNAFDSNVTEANGTAVFRFLNTTNGVHFYTAAADEAASLRLNAGFRDEGISYYASNDASNGGTALFRFYNTQNNSHFYTVSEAERDSIINTIGHYKYENVAFYVDAA